MDGFTGRWQDVMTATPPHPVGFKIIGESRAGAQFDGEVESGEAIRISTDAVLACGCDTVIRVENTKEGDGIVHIKHVRSQGQDIRRCGQEFVKGEQLHSRGMRLYSAAADCGYTHLFWRILQNPAKPLYFARNSNTLLFGLPGNPVSAFMCFTHYVKPLITALNGLTFGWPMISAEASDEIVNLGKRPNMIRVKAQFRRNSR